MENKLGFFWSGRRLRFVSESVMATTTTVKGYRGMGMEGPIARWYARITRPSLPEFQAIAQRVAAAGPARRQRAGGGARTRVFRDRVGQARWPPRDRTRHQPHLRRDRATAMRSRPRVDVDFQQGNAAAMPFPADSFDYLLCRAAFKNFSDPEAHLAKCTAFSSRAAVR